MNGAFAFGHLPSAAQLHPDPFPHVVADHFFPQSIFDELSREFPECPPGSGPTGFTVHRGDDAFEHLMSRSFAWRQLHESINNQAFIDAIVKLFAEPIGVSCLVAASDLRFSDHVEGRREKEQATILSPKLRPEELFVRFDLMEGRDTYSRQRHLDHRRRLTTLLVYFNDPGDATFKGGHLVLHGSGVSSVRIAPAANRAVLFACNENSWHSVEPVHSVGSPRRFIQISVSSCHDLWPGEKPRRGWGRHFLAQGFKRAMKRG